MAVNQKSMEICNLNRNTGEGSTFSLQELVHMAHNSQMDIQKMRVSILPQPRLLMLLEREKELRKGLQKAAKVLFRQRKYAKQKNITQLHANSQKALCDLGHFFSVLRSVRYKVIHDLLGAEKEIQYADFYALLKKYKKILRHITAGLATKNDNSSEIGDGGKSAQELFAAASAINDIKERKARLEQMHPQSKYQAYCKTFDVVFSSMERQAHLAAVNMEVKSHLRAISYNHVSQSNVFDDNYYRSQLADPQEAKDCVKHYVSSNSASKLNPSKFFNHRYYHDKYAEVQRLRYNALEHFFRYGENFLYNPFPEFDAIFYLENNDDVLDAGVSAFRHFIRHGIREERPPSAKAENFFIRRYTNSTSRRKLGLLFIGNPDNQEKNAWNTLWDISKRTQNIEAFRMEGEQLSQHSGHLDGYVICGQAMTALNDEALEAIALSGGKIIYFGNFPQRDLARILGLKQSIRNKVFAITNNYKRFIRWQESVNHLRLHFSPFDESVAAVLLLEALFDRLAGNDEFSPRKFITPSQNIPAISVVSIIYKKSAEMCAFLESLNRQDLAEHYEVILINDASPDDAVQVVEKWIENKRAADELNKFMQISILHNESNLGNCISRNTGVNAARAEIVLVADGDMVFNTSHLTEHCLAYRFGDCDAVIGFFYFNVDYAFVFDCLAACEICPEIVRKRILRASRVLGPMRNPVDGIYNFVTRNVSFRKSALNGEYYDPAFTYSARPESGYGEEDHEMGARLYFAGRKVKFIADSIGVHIRHQDNSYSANKILGNLRNWNRLIAKHPELMLVDRQNYQWRTLDYLHKIRNYPESKEFKEAYDLHFNEGRVNIVIKTSKKLNILTYRWHAAHQYELFKFSHDFTLACHNGTRMCDAWGYSQRPLPYNVQFKPLEAIDINDYDFAILPFDEHVLSPEQSNGILPPDWGQAFLTMLELTRDLPRAAICHGTPRFYGAFLQYCEKIPENYGQTLEPSRQEFRELLRDVHVVCNSHQAQRQWNFHKSSVIWHGFSPGEFPPGAHEKACLTLPKAAFESRPLYRGKRHMEMAKELLENICTIEYTAPPPPHPGYTKNSQEWAVAKFHNYARYIGEFAIYFNPTLRSPMPRSRAEAMMTGTIPVSIRSHDVEMFIKNGVNGFYGDSAEESAKQIKWLLKNDEKRAKISKNARHTAMDIFNIDRYLSSWSYLISKL